MSYSIFYYLNHTKIGAKIINQVSHFKDQAEFKTNVGRYQVLYCTALNMLVGVTVKKFSLVFGAGELQMG